MGTSEREKAKPKSTKLIQLFFASMKKWPIIATDKNNQRFH